MKIFIYCYDCSLCHARIHSERNSAERHSRARAPEACARSFATFAVTFIPCSHAHTFAITRLHARMHAQREAVQAEPNSVNLPTTMWGSGVRACKPACRPVCARVLACSTSCACVCPGGLLAQRSLVRRHEVEGGGARFERKGGGAYSRKSRDLTMRISSSPPHCAHRGPS